MRQFMVALIILLNASAAAATDILNVNTSHARFLIQLPANPTTGYQWKLINYDQSFLQLLSANYTPTANKMIGAGGQMTFVFGLIKGKNYPKNTLIQLSYQRPWEPEKGTAKEIAINFVADDEQENQ